MTVFACARCDAVLTAPVTRIALPVHARHSYGHDLLPPLMDPGTYAVDPEPSGPPWRPWNEIAADEAEARGIFAPVHTLSFGPPGAIVVAPGDTRGTVLIPERCDGYCMGLDGRDGPNLACAHCGQEVATRIDDCSYWQAVWLVPHAVRRLTADGPTRPAVDWETLAQQQGTPPIEPPGVWSPRWEAAIGAALAYLLAASEGAPVAVPDGLAMDVFGRVLDVLLPPGPPAKRAILAGPGLPAPDPAPDIVLVPRHPRTGQVWQPSTTMETVPLAADVWTYLAFPREGLPLPVTGRMPDGVLRDEPLPRHPWGSFRADSRVFLHTLARLPAVRQPWLRRIYDQVKDHPYARPF
ncbi:hypothetical protein ACFY41_01120 [Streptomyces syringium]|uniref:hypothetical protein n=1 Tax=Streptomyces syringium TaxID=76729 RepID=UPI0036827D91